MRNNLEPTSLILERIPELMGLDMRWNASKRFWYGHYYMDGTLHGKKDKLKVKVYNNSRNGRIYVYEQGGESIPLTTWLVRYGGAIDERDAMSRMLGRRISSVKLRPDHIMKDIIPLRYVDSKEFVSECVYEYERSPLYVWMCSLFPSEEVKSVWERYRVTVNPSGLVCYWYVNQSGEICHDKRIRYGYDGHRLKGSGCSRRFKVSDGYAHYCLFGQHLVGKGYDDGEVCVVESEKTCLLCALEFPDKLFVATGGKSNLNLALDIDGAVLYPDFDAIDAWSKSGMSMHDWWTGNDVSGTDDIGDLVVRMRKEGGDL